MAPKSKERQGADSLISLLTGDDGNAKLAKRFIKLPKDRQQRFLRRMELVGDYDPAMQVSLDLGGIISLIRSLI